MVLQPGGCLVRILSVLDFIKKSQYITRELCSLRSRISELIAAMLQKTRKFQMNTFI